MILKDISFQSPQENILFDDALLTLAEKEERGEFLRFWESPVLFIVLGRVGKEQDDLRIPEVIKDGLAVLRRSSGGGTVIQGPGCLNYSLILDKRKNPRLSDIRQSYQIILNEVILALKTAGADCSFKPTSDLALVSNDKKISGNAQKRGRNFILHHGTILYNLDLRLIERYLTIPKDVPEYRKGRSHMEFVSNVTLNVAHLKQALKDRFKIDEQEFSLSQFEKNCLKNFLESRNVLIDLKSQTPAIH